MNATCEYLIVPFGRAEPYLCRRPAAGSYPDGGGAKRALCSTHAHHGDPVAALTPDVIEALTVAAEAYKVLVIPSRTALVSDLPPRRALLDAGIRALAAIKEGPR